MLAARFIDPDRPFSVEDVPTPTPSPDEVLVDVRAASLCGTDAHYYHGGFEPATSPLTMGHEGAGVVAETGDAVTHLSEGDHVVVHYPVSCDHCDACLDGYDNRCRNRQSIGTHLDGTFAEYITVPARNALAVAPDVPFDWGSIAGCAVSTAYHAVKRSGLAEGDTAIVFGIGGVGMHAVMWADFFGAATILAVDPIDAKLDFARAYGADVAIDPARDDVADAVAAATDGLGVDIAIECSGSPQAMDDAIRSIDGDNRYASGSAVSVGLQHEPLEATYWGLREGQLLVSGDHTRAELRTIIDLMESGTIDLANSITHRVPLERLDDGIELMGDGSESVGRIILDLP